jgi:hypothetical protein
MFNKILTIPPYDPKEFTIPYLYLSSDRSGKHDSIYSFRQNINSRENFYLQFKDGIHEDFSSLPSIAKKVQPTLNNVNSDFHTNIHNIATLFFSKYLLSENVNVAAYIDSLKLSNPKKYISG